MNQQKPVVLVADDDPVTLRLLSGILEDQYEVLTVENAVDALVATTNIQIDVIIIDIFMPNLNGIDLCKRLTDDDKMTYVPIIFISSSDDIRDRTACFSAGCVDFIQKPFTSDDVRSRVHAHYKGRQCNRELQQRLDQNLAERYCDLVDNKLHDGVGNAYIDKPE